MRHRSNSLARFLLIAVTGLAFPAAANDFRLSSVSLEPDSSAPLQLTFAASPEPIVGIQFDLEYDSNALQLTAIAGDAARSAGKTLAMATLDSRRTRFLLSGWNQTPIFPGRLIDFVVRTAPSAALQSFPVRISNLIATFPNGQQAPVAATDGEVTVIAGDAKRLSSSGILNGASFVAGAVAPGELVTRMGTSLGPAIGMVPESGASSPILGGTSVWFDGVQAPMLYAGAGQINVVVPYEVGGETTQLVVRSGGLIAAELPAAVAPASPAIFTRDGSGTGPGAILNQDAKANSPTNPTRRGQVISIYATGAGAMTPAASNGAIGQGTSQHPVLPVTVRIGGVTAEVLYAGAAPGLISGALQVNCRVPADTPSGFAVEVELKVGEFASPRGVTVAIE